MMKMQSLREFLVRLVGRRGERRSRATRGMAQGLLVALVMLIFLNGTGLLRGWGNSTLDLWFALRNVVPHDDGASIHVGVLAIDTPTRRAWNGRNFDAKDVGRILILLKENGILAVAVAVPDLERGFLSPRDKAIWENAIEVSGIAHLPQQATTRLISSNGQMAEHNEFLRFFKNDSLQSDSLNLDGNGAKWPQKMRRGHTAFLVDSDAHVRRVPLVLQSNVGLYPSLSLSTAIQGLGIAPSQVVPTDKSGRATSWARARAVRLGGRSIALEPNGELLLNFWTASDNSADNDEAVPSSPIPRWPRALATPSAAPPSAPSSTSVALVDEIALGDQSSTRLASNPTFDTLSLATALRQPSLLRQWKGRCVVIGVTDSQAAPQWTLAGGARVPEATIHAIALENLLSGNALESVAPLQMWLLTIFLCMTVGGLVGARPPLWSGLVTGLALLAVALLSLGLFIQSLWLDISLPCLAAALTFLQGVVSRARLQERETTRVSSTVEALERAGAIIAARGQSQELLERVLHWTLAAMGADAAIALILEEAPEGFNEHDADNSEKDASTVREPRFRVLASVQRKLRALDVLPIEARDEIAARVTMQTQPMLIQDAHRDPRFRYGRSYYTNFRPLSSPGALSITSVIAAPLREGDPTADDPLSGVRTVGAIMVLNRRDGTPFHARDLELLTAVTNQASVALDNVRLYEILNQRVARSESDLERTNRRLEAEKSTLQTVLESMTDGVVVTNNEGRIQILNSAARALLPEMNANVLGCTLAQILPDVAASVAARAVQSSSVYFAKGDSLAFGSTSVASPAVSLAASSDGSNSMESEPDEMQGESSTRSAHVPDLMSENYRVQAEITSPQIPLNATLLPLIFTLELQRGDIDAPRVIAVNSAPLLSTDSKDAGVVWVFSDVTEEKSIEQAKSDFVAFVAHEMRSPLTSISGFSLMLQRMEKPDDAGATSRTRSELAPREKSDKNGKKAATRERFLGVIYNESERLTRLINNLLDVARLEAGRDLAINLENLDFATVAGEAIESQRVYSSRHTLLNDVSPNLPPLYADRDKVLQILINLLSNAMKYSPGGVVTVAARVEKHLLIASVSDEGPGIAPEHRERLFERFGRTGARDLKAKNPGAGEHAKPTGTGLGLFLTRHLVESHGGRIWLDGEAEQGARFCLSLPLLSRGETSSVNMSSLETSNIEYSIDG